MRGYWNDQGKEYYVSDLVRSQAYHIVKELPPLGSDTYDLT